MLLVCAGCGGIGQSYAVHLVVVKMLDTAGGRSMLVDVTLTDCCAAACCREVKRWAEEREVGVAVGVWIGMR